MNRTLPMAALGLSLVACEAPAQTYYPQPYGYGYAAPYDYGYAPPPPPIERPPFQFAPPPGFNYGAGPMGGYANGYVPPPPPPLPFMRPGAMDLRRGR